MGVRTWFSLEDAKASFNLFCMIYGVGTLGMPGNFARAGPVLASLALAFMAIANIYASVVCSKVLLLAPKSVKTFGDLGEWCMGKPGRWLVLVAQLGYCLLAPCVFLVLGGSLLIDIFPNTFGNGTFIVLMAISLTPLCLVPTLKEGAGAALAGSVGTLIADVIGIAVLLHGMKGHPSVVSPDISVEQVALTFGNLSQAYGCAIVIPAIQRQHSQPERMPRVIFVTMTFITALFAVLAGTGYSAMGCQIAGNLLFSIYPDAATGLSQLGFTPNRGIVLLAFLCMQLHITVAFSIFLNPAMYLVERTFLGMHKLTEDDVEAVHYTAEQTPKDERKSRGSLVSGVSIADIECENDGEAYDEAKNYKGHEWKYIPVRIVIIAVLTLFSVLIKDRLSDLNDFIGASCIALSSVVLPVTFYLKKRWTHIPLYEKLAGVVFVVVFLGLGTYVTIKSGKALFNPDPVQPDAPTFKFCPKEHQYDLYYNYTLVHGQ